MNIKKVGIIALLLLAMFLSLGSCTDSYEKTAESAYDKFSNGDFDSMTDAEKAHIDGFLDWLDKQ